MKQIYEKKLTKTKAVLFYILQIIGRQEWIRLGIRDRIIRFFVNPDTCNSYEFKIHYFGLDYKGNLNNFIDWNVYFYGGYEKNALKLIKELLNNRSNPVCLDIGANVGTYSIFMSSFCKEVYAFEPNESAAKALKINKELNGVTNIFIYNIGLGEKTRKAALSIPLKCSTSNSRASFIPALVQDAEKKVVMADIVRGDEIIDELKLKKIDLIKIDVEGFEKNVLIGLKETIRKYRPIIFMEFTDFTRKSFQNIDEWNSIFNKYEIFEVIEGVPLLIFFNRAPSYRLIKFDFATARAYGSILCLPN